MDELVGEEVQVDAFRCDIGGDQHDGRGAVTAEIVYDLLEVDVVLAGAAVQHLDLAGL